MLYRKILIIHQQDNYPAIAAVNKKTPNIINSLVKYEQKMAQIYIRKSRFRYGISVAEKHRKKINEEEKITGIF